MTRGRPADVGPGKKAFALISREEAEEEARKLAPGRRPSRTRPDKKAPVKSDVPSWYAPHGARNVADGGASVLTPLYITEALGGNVGSVGIVSAATSMAAIPSAIGWGTLSDHLQRRKLFIVLGYLGTGLMYILMGLCIGVLDFIGLNVLLGIVTAASVPVGTLIITEMMSPKQWPHQIGLYTKVGGVGWILGLLLGGVWLELGASGLDTATAMRILFIILGTVALLAGLLAVKMVPEPPRKPFAPHRVDKLVIFQGRIVERTRYLPLWMYRRRYHGEMHRIRTGGLAVPKPLRLYFLATLLLFAGYQTVFTPFPIFLRGVVRSGGLEIFLIYLVNSIASAVMYSRVGDIITIRGEKNILLKVNLARAGVFAVFAVIAALAVLRIPLPREPLVVLIFVMMGTSGFLWAFVGVASTTLVTKAAPPDAKGENVGIFNAVVSVGGILGALTGGYVALTLGYAVSFFAGTGLVLTGLLVLGLNRGLDALHAPAPKKEWTAP
jgi:MFS family permease